MTKVFNVDALQPEPKFSIVVNGETHNMRPQSIDDLIFMLKAMEELEKEPSMLREVELMTDVVARAFPTAGRELLGSIPLDTLSQLFAFVRGVEDEESAGGENPPAAES